MTYVLFEDDETIEDRNNKIEKLRARNATVNVQESFRLDRISYRTALKLTKLSADKQNDLLKLKKKEILLAVKEAIKEQQRGNSSSHKIKSTFTTEEMQLIDNAVQRAKKEGREELIRDAVLSFCSDFYPSKFIKECDLPFQMKWSYSDKDHKVINGISRFERDCIKFQDENRREPRRGEDYE